MSTAAERDPYFDVDGCSRHFCDERCAPTCWDDDQPDAPRRGVHPADVALLDGPAADALFGLEHIRDVPLSEVPGGVMVQAVLGAQRLAAYAKAQAVYWTAAFARPGVAVPMSNLLASVAHRADEQGRDCPVPGELVERAAAGHTVFGDPQWDALLASEAAGLAEPELSAAWLVAPITARRRIADAHELVDELPDTFQALEDGRIEEIRARVIAETTHHIDPHLRGRAEQLILDRARPGMSPGDLRRLASKVVADLDPDAAGKRAEQARARRGTHVRNLDDDLARFTADLAVEDAALTEALLDLLAQAIPTEARQGRGISQLRADIFADLFTELADTGLIDLRGLNPNTTDPTEPADTDTAPTDPESTDPDEPAADTEHPATPPDAGEPGQPLRDDGTEPEPEPQSVDTDTDSSPNGSSPAGSDQRDPGAGDTHPDPDRSGPTAAELLARLRSSDWESRLDPNGQRRGGLLSLVRLPAGMRVNLDVTIALSTLAGCDDLSARLTGLGVITADTARALTTAAGTVRILVTHNPPDPPTPGSPPGPARRNHGGLHHHSPDCGTVLDFGRTTYRPPATVIDRVNTRDQRCRFPGCPMAAERCDHDHRTTWDTGGATCPCNIDTLCRFHHRNKTFTTWTAIRDHQANTLTWTSPLGRVHVDRPTPDLPTGTPLNLSGTEASSLGGNAPARPPGAEADHRDPDHPPF